jgi:hypothetical protein
MSNLMTGGCLCGAVRYEYSVEPIFSGNCHCRDCQRTSGTGFSANMFIPSNIISITGDVKYFDSNGRSGHIVSRGFCPTCGSQIFGKPTLIPNVIAVRAGTLDDPALYQPSMDIFTEEVPAWDAMNPDLPKFPQMPPQ